MDDSELYARAFDLVASLERFDRECASKEYTDTGTAWELLNAATGLLAEAIDYKSQEEITLDDLTEAERAEAERVNYTHLYRLGNSRAAIAQDGAYSHTLTPEDQWD